MFNSNQLKFLTLISLFLLGFGEGKAQTQTLNSVEIAADGSTSNITGELPFTVSFTSNVQTSTGSTHLLYYFWNPGDGNTGLSGQNNFPSNLENFTHTYSQPGVYQASLLVYNSTGQNESDNITITVTVPESIYDIEVPTLDDAYLNGTTRKSDANGNRVFVREANPNSSSPADLGYLKFDISNIVGDITDIELTLEHTLGQSGTLTVYQGNSNGWREACIGGPITSTCDANEIAIPAKVMPVVASGISVNTFMPTSFSLENVDITGDYLTFILETSDSQLAFASQEEGFYTSPKLTLTVDNSPPATPIYFEAECATVGSRWSRKNQQSASNDKYLLYPGRLQHYTTPPNTSDQMVKFQFLLTEAATYDIYTRILVNNKQNNSFWVRINNDSWIKFSDIPRKSFFQWVHIFDNNNDGATITYDFTAGFHTIDIAVMEDGTKLDKLALIPPGNVAPTGEGPDATNCQGGNSSNTNEEMLLIGSNKEQSTTTYSIDNQASQSPTKNIEVYPNPFSSEITLDMHLTEEQASVYVFDATGKLVEDYNNVDATQQLQVGKNLPNGIYFVQIKSASGTFQKKIYKVVR